MTQMDLGAPVILVATERPSVQTKGRGSQPGAIVPCALISGLGPLQLCVSLEKTCSDCPSLFY